jgi:hypothetical protein
VLILRRPLVQEQGVVRRRFERQVAAQRSWSDALDVAASEMSGCAQADDAAIANWDVDVRHDLVVPNSEAEIGATLAASRGQPAAITPTYKSGAVAAASNNAPSANSELELEEDDDGLLVYLKDEKGHPAGEWPLRVFVAEAMAEYRNGRTIQAGIRRVIELCGGGRGLARVILYRIAEFETGEEARVWLVHDIDRVLAELEPPVKGASSVLTQRDGAHCKFTELPAFRGQALAPTIRRRGDVGSSESDQTVIDPSVYRRTLHHQRRLQLPGERRVSGALSSVCPLLLLMTHDQGYQLSTTTLAFQFRLISATASIKPLYPHPCSTGYSTSSAACRTLSPRQHIVRRSITPARPASQHHLGT